MHSPPRLPDVASRLSGELCQQCGQPPAYRAGSAACVNVDCPLHHAYGEMDAMEDDDAHFGVGAAAGSRDHEWQGSRGQEGSRAGQCWPEERRSAGPSSAPSGAFTTPVSFRGDAGSRGLAAALASSVDGRHNKGPMGMGMGVGMGAQSLTGGSSSPSPPKLPTEWRTPSPGQAGAGAASSWAARLQQGQQGGGAGIEGQGQGQGQGWEGAGRYT